MKTLSPDTHPEAEQLQLELIRQMPTWKKMAMIGALTDTVRTLALSGIRQRHPEASPEEIQYMLAELMLGDELARKVYSRVE